MDKLKSSMAEQIAQAAIAFEQRRTGNHVPTSVAVRSQRTTGQRIARAARAFEERQTKHGRKWVVVFMNEDTIVIALHGSMTAAEQVLAQSPAGAARVREFHRRMFTDAAIFLHRSIKSITGMEVRNTTTDIEPKTGHVVNIFTTDTVGEEFLRVPGGSAANRAPGHGSLRQHEGNYLRETNETTGCVLQGCSPEFYREDFNMKTDTELQTDVMDEIKWEPSTKAAQIGVTAANGVVTLTGTVATYAEKWAVERAAQRVEGVKGLAEEITIKPYGVHIKNDTEIAEAALNSLKWHVWVPTDIQVTVAQGWVTLKGNVNWEYERTAAYDAVCFMPGVKGVSNEIALKPSAQPAGVKNAIEKALVRNAEIDAGTVKVAANGGAVTLSGSVRSWNEKDQAGSAAWNAPGVNSVRNDIEVSYA